MRLVDPKGRMRIVYSGVDSRGCQIAWVRAGLLKKERKRQYGRYVEENLAARLVSEGWKVAEQ